MVYWYGSRLNDMTYEMKIREERREAVTLESLFDIKEEEIRRLAKENHLPINESRA